MRLSLVTITVVSALLTQPLSIATDN